MIAFTCGVCIREAQISYSRTVLPDSYRTGWNRKYSRSERQKKDRKGKGDGVDYGYNRPLMCIFHAMGSTRRTYFAFPAGRGT